MVAEILKAVLSAPERMLHQLRREAGLDALARRGPTYSLLVVCQGNICRSPFAAAVIGRMLAPFGVRVTSAGLIGPGRPAPPAAIDAARRHGVDLSAHESHLLEANAVHAAQLIIVMDLLQARAVCERFGRRPSDVVLIGDFDPEPIEARAIRDPVDQPVDVFLEVYARLDRCGAELARVLSGHLAVVTGQ